MNSAAVLGLFRALGCRRQILGIVAQEIGDFSKSAKFWALELQQTKPRSRILKIQSIRKFASFKKLLGGSVWSFIKCQNFYKYIEYFLNTYGTEEVLYSDSQELPPLWRAVGLSCEIWFTSFKQTRIHDRPSTSRKFCCGKEI